MPRSNEIYRPTATEYAARDHGDEEEEEEWGVRRVVKSIIAALNVARALLVDKRTFRATAVLSCVLLVWILVNVASMTGNVNELTEPTHFWKNVRRVARKTIKASPCRHEGSVATTTTTDMISRATTMAVLVEGAKDAVEGKEERGGMGNKLGGEGGVFLDYDNGEPTTAKYDEEEKDGTVTERESAEQREEGRKEIGGGGGSAI